MRVPKQPFVFYSKLRSFTVLPERSFVFYSEVRNFAVSPKRTFVFLTAKYKILQFYQNDHLIFYSEIQNLENCTRLAIRSFTTKNKFFKVAPKWPFVF